MRGRGRVRRGVRDLAAPGRPGDGGGSRPPALLSNAAAICAGGSVVGTYRKRVLPNYGVFDEQRWFVPGSGPLALYEIGGVAVGVSICEDVWSPEGPVVDLGRGGAELVVNINASPYSHGRWEERLSMLRERVAQAGCALAYCNLVGGQDELVFDGASIVIDRDGSVLAAAGQFTEELTVLDVAVGSTNGSRPRTLSVVGVSGPGPAQAPLLAPSIRSPLPPSAEIYEALVLGTRDYLSKNGFTDAWSGSPAASTPRWWPRSPPTRSAPTTCMRSRCRLATRAAGPSPTRSSWPAASGSMCGSSPSTPPTRRWRTCSPRYSVESRTG
jgi:hypothetical protein